MAKQVLAGYRWYVTIVHMCVPIHQSTLMLSTDHLSVSSADAILQAPAGVRQHRVL